MNSLPTRAISALIAVTILIGLTVIFKVNGLHFAVFLVVLLGGRELVKLLFLPEDSVFDRGLFYVFVLAIFLISVFDFQRSTVTYVGFSILYFSLNMWRHRTETNLAPISVLHAKSLLGFFYLGLLPVFADRVLWLTHGMIWFFVLLAIVFAGDIFAFLFGVNWGRHKIMPAISPKKSMEGALGGLFGSVVASLVASYFLPQVPIYVLAAMGLLVGMIGQFGDFFESLLKRVADLKDSGSIMPGHGGVLDRLDGVLFAAPFVYLTASFFESIVQQ